MRKKLFLQLLPLLPCCVLTLSLLASISSSLHAQQNENNCAISTYNLSVLRAVLIIKRKSTEWQTNLDSMEQQILNDIAQHNDLTYTHPPEELASFAEVIASLNPYSRALNTIANLINLQDLSSWSLEQLTTMDAALYYISQNNRGIAQIRYRLLINYYSQSTLHQQSTNGLISNSSIHNLSLIILNISLDSATGQGIREQIALSIADEVIRRSVRFTEEEGAINQVINWNNEVINRLHQAFSILHDEYHDQTFINALSRITPEMERRRLNTHIDQNPENVEPERQILRSHLTDQQWTELEAMNYTSSPEQEEQFISHLQLCLAENILERLLFPNN